MEHFYHTIDGFMNDRNRIMLDHVIQDFPAGGTWVELGSWTGRSAAYCIVELIRANKLGRFVCVDDWSGGQELASHSLQSRVHDIFQHNMQPVQSQFEILDCCSWAAADQFEPESVDFCYVDAGHDYDSVSQDLTAWWPRMRPGSWFAGDDYTKGYPGLQRAVWDFFEPKKIRVRRMGRCWIVRKPNDLA